MNLRRGMQRQGNEEYIDRKSGVMRVAWLTDAIEDCHTYSSCLAMQERLGPAISHLRLSQTSLHHLASCDVR